MDITLIILLAIIVVAALYFISLYNHLVRLKHGVSVPGPISMYC